MRQFNKFFEQSELVHQFEGGGMDGVAPEIAKEIGVFFQYRDIDTRAREQVAGHYSGRTAADDHATPSHFRQRVHRPKLKEDVSTDSRRLRIVAYKIDGEKPV